MTLTRAVIDLGRLSALLIFILLGLRVVWHRRRGHSEHGAVVAFISYAVVVSCIAGFSQIEAWPFTTWALVHHLSATEFATWQIYGVDRNGRPYAVDHRFVEPLPYEDFDTWLKQHFLLLDRPRSATLRDIPPREVTARQRPVAQFLLNRAEAARIRFVQTGRVGTNGRFLGPLAAPYHFVRADEWRTQNDVPETPFVRMQIWQERWNLEERLRDPHRVQRQLVFDYGS